MTSGIDQGASTQGATRAPSRRGTTPLFEPRLQPASRSWTTGMWSIPPSSKSQDEEHAAVRLTESWKDGERQVSLKTVVAHGSFAYRQAGSFLTQLTRVHPRLLPRLGLRVTLPEGQRAIDPLALAAVHEYLGDLGSKLCLHEVTGRSDAAPTRYNAHITPNGAHTFTGLDSYGSEPLRETVGRVDVGAAALHAALLYTAARHAEEQQAAAPTPYAAV